MASLAACTIKCLSELNLVCCNSVCVCVCVWCVCVCCVCLCVCVCVCTHVCVCARERNTDRVVCPAQFSEKGLSLT